VPEKTGRCWLCEDYDVSSTVLGQGLGGDVLLARGRAAGGRFAVKTVPRSSAGARRLPEEAEIHMQLTHPNIARLHGIYEGGGKVCLVMECCDGGELYARLQKRGAFPDAEAAEASRQMLRAVAYLHSRCVVHRDLKLENFLYESEEPAAQLKLIDFGFAHLWDPLTPMQAPCGSPSYVSPEVLSRSGYTHKCDLWSLGVVVWMLLCGYPPFHGEERQMLAQIKAGEPDWSHRKRWKHVSEDAVELVTRLLALSPEQRPEAREALRHAWLRKGADAARRMAGA